MGEEPGMFSKEAQDLQISNANAALAALAGGSLKVTDLFRNRKDGKPYIEKPPSMSIEDVVMQGSRIIAAEAETVEFTRTFKARPYDGAVAFQAVLEEHYGFGALGKTIKAFFGEVMPEFKTVTVGLRVDPETGHKSFETIEVPWNLMEFAPLHAQFMLHEREDADYGWAFGVQVQAPKKMQAAITGLFMLVEEYLRVNSIYRGKALYGVGRRDRHGRITEPEFTNPYETDRNRIVYSSDVWRMLHKNVITRIIHTDEVRKDETSIGAKILLMGENGTGKTEFTKIAAQYAVENGWGAIQARYDEDIAQVVAFAERLGTPTIVCIEDVEKLIPEDGNSQRMDQLLDLFDGAGSKGREVLLLMTTNHVAELNKSMTRAGRIDRQIPVGSLDKEGVERLINVTIPAERREDLDYEALHEAYEGFSPSWIMESLKGLRLAAIDRTGVAGSPYATEDFVIEAHELRPAWERHQSATDKPITESFTDAFRREVTEVVGPVFREHKMDRNDDFKIVPADA